MRNFADIMTSFPGLEAIDLGNLRALWLPSQVPLRDDELAAGVHLSEWEKAGELKAPSRRSEYLRSRYLIRRLTGHAGILTPKTAGDPSWPPGVVGSLTHKSGSVGVLLEDEAQYASVGIDAEEVAKVRLELAPKILNEAETALLARGSDERSLALMFSFKESLFKCHFPLGRKMFYFHDAEVVEIDAARGRVRARMLMDSSPRTLKGSLVEGSYVFKDEFVLTATSLVQKH